MGEAKKKQYRVERWEDGLADGDKWVRMGMYATLDEADKAMNDPKDAKDGRILRLVRVIRGPIKQTVVQKAVVTNEPVEA